MADDSDQTDPGEPTGARPTSGRRDRVVEGLSAILLALAAVVAAWCGYQSARWGGVQATAIAEANAARLEASRASATGGELTQIDVATFFQAVNAYAVENTELFDFYVKRMRPEFRPVFDEWMALEPRTNPDAPLSPFALSSYSVAELERAQRLNRVAEDETTAAAAARERANAYAIVVVFLAAALFFAGVSTKFSSFGMRIALLGIGAALFLGVVVRVLLMPISFGV
jgi:ferric-dicitrate binding protein FerR (iron transport regulator)